MGTTSGNGARRDPWSIFWLLVVIQFMVILDTGIVAIALPSVRADLGFSPEGLAWVMDGYMLVLGGLVLLGGRAADLVGRRRMLLWGVVLFTAASALCTVAVEPWMLVAGRVLQGVGAAMASPAALATVTDLFEDGPDRTKAMGIFGGVGGVAGPVGVLLGGLLAGVDWRLVFLINLPIGLVIVLLGLRLLPAVRPVVGGGLDVFGAFTGTVGLSLVVYAAIRGGVSGWGGTAVLVSLAAAAVLLVAFVVRQRTATTPLLPRALFRAPALVLGVVACGLVGFALYGVFVSNSVHLQDARGYGPVSAALVMIPLDLCLFLGTNLAGRLLGRVGGPVNLLLTGLVVQAVGLVWWATALDVHGNLVVTFILPAGVASVGLGLAIVSVFVIATMGTTDEVAGATSGLLVMSNQVIGAIGIAVLTTVVALRSRDLIGAGVDRAAALGSAQSAALYAAVGAVVVAIALGLLLKRLNRVTSAAAEEGDPVTG
ncbi:MFS transporter [Saccharothrix obliqua]|uniref:MFS transporter n=1 Tax=Saccharothrix obliqua TaxID=2861747 RepID=UPI001C60615E|nr:MFS transporter [Saccharothrix obliqua]MBW4721488.1 MFS transporter [Saccharothrix obliqua]